MAVPGLAGVAEPVGLAAAWRELTDAGRHQEVALVSLDLAEVLLLRERARAAVLLLGLVGEGLERRGMHEAGLRVWRRVRGAMAGDAGGGEAGAGAGRQRAARPSPRPASGNGGWPVVRQYATLEAEMRWLTTSLLCLLLAVAGIPAIGTAGADRHGCGMACCRRGPAMQPMQTPTGVALPMPGASCSHAAVCSCRGTSSVPQASVPDGRPSVLPVSPRLPAPALASLAGQSGFRSPGPPLLDRLEHPPRA